MTLSRGEDADAGNVPTAASGSSRGRHLLQQGQTLPVYSGQALTLTEASEVLGRQEAEVVVLVGEVGVGKTTLLAALYECLATGPIEGWEIRGIPIAPWIRGSKLCATVASGLSHPDTARTSRGTEQVMLHLSVRMREGVVRTLLLSDVSGEYAEELRLFDEAGDSTAPCSRSATRILLLVDGAMLVATRDQNLPIANSGTLLRAIVQGPDIRPNTPLEIVITKWDLCRDSEGLLEELDRLRMAAEKTSGSR